MNKQVKEKLDLIAQMVGYKFKSEPIAVELKEAKLEDGTMVSFDNLNVGTAVNVITEDGVSNPIEDGVYNIDGYTITTENGVIIEAVEIPVEEEIPAVEEEMVEDEPIIPTEEIVEPEEEVTEPEEVTEDIASRLDALENAISNLVGIIEGMTEDMASTKKKCSSLETENIELKSQVTILSKQPAVQNIDLKLQNTTTNAAELKMLTQIEALKKLKK